MQCHKTKIKIVTLAYHKEGRPYSEPVNKNVNLLLVLYMYCSWRETAENEWKGVTIDFTFTNHVP